MNKTLPIAILEPTLMEVGRPVRGRPSYAWVQAYYVHAPDGHKLYPPMQFREAVRFCLGQGWTAKKSDSAQITS